MMKKFMKALPILLALLMLVSACAPQSNSPIVPTQAPENPAVVPPTENGLFTPGTYTATATGHNGPVTIKVEVDKDAILSCELIESVETSGIGDVAFAKISDALVQTQAIPVDVVAGCTLSAVAMRSAVEEALREATGGDLSKLAAAPAAKVGQPQSLETDVVVIGSGVAGMTAAIQAAKDGAKVLVIEKLPRNGGSTRTSSGMIVAAGTPVQRAGGIEDSIEALKEYWLDRGEGNVDETMVVFAAEKAVDSLQFVMDQGVEYLPEGITISGTTTVLRAHVPTGLGASLMDGLVRSAEKLSVEIMLETTAKKLVMQNGAVTGVEAERQGASVTIAAKSVVIATGGFDKSEELKAKYGPAGVGAWAVSAPGNVGDGLLMGIEAGADTVFKNGYIGWKVVSPVYGHTTAIGTAMLVGATSLLVDEQGGRIVNEGLDYPFIFHKMVENGSKKFYYVLDAAHCDVNVLEEAVKANVAFKADSIEELAAVTGLPNLAKTIERYNVLAQQGKDEDFGKDASLLAALETGPYYVIQAVKGTLGSFGGLKVNIAGNVLNKSGEGIPGLYAAGEVANGDFFNDTYPASGSSISMCVTFGLEAGKSAATNAK